MHIYRGQLAVFERAAGRAGIAERLAEMRDHEREHLTAFDAMLTDRQVRPTLLAPLWRIGGFAMGAATALMGEKAAHACTEAVESVIERHYADQVEEVQDQEPELAADLARFRDEELAHRDEAVAEGAREAPGYPVLSAVIGGICRAAIKVSEKV